VRELIFCRLACFCRHLHSGFAAGADECVRPYTGVFRDFFYCVSGVDVELCAAGIFYCDVQGAEDQFGALQVDGVAQ
jgi:hypothetical protein